ncbi:MAG: hypothetical protein Q9159_006009 [Coniocarpon cinnabarinum]
MTTSARHLRPFASTSTLSSTPSSAPSAQTAILDAAMSHVPALGFTKDALLRGAHDAGYLPTSLALLSHGAFELVKFHLITQRTRLKDALPWHNSDASDPNSAHELQPDARLEQTLLTRLRANSPIIHQYATAIAIMSLARNIPPSLAELGRLSDEMLFLAGDTSVDSSWYMKRAAVAATYAASETFMTQDQSTDFIDTRRSLHRRLEDVRVLGQGAADVGQFLGFAGISTINILRSWNMRI